MARVWLILLLAAAWAGAQESKHDSAPKPKAEAQEQIPPEEDESLAVKEYSFNPLQASKEVRVGDYYFKKGSYNAAAHRYREATKWNNGFAEAFLKLGEAEEKRKDRKAAREAYSRYLELAPDARNADEIRKKISKM